MGKPSSKEKLGRFFVKLQLHIRGSWFYYVALTAALAHACRWINFEWITFALLLLGGLPVWFPLVCAKIRFFRRTKDGWVIGFAGSVDASEQPKSSDKLPESAAEPTNERSVNDEIVARAGFPTGKYETFGEALADYFSLTKGGQDVVHTLGYFQKRVFPTDPTKRWCFTVSPEAPDYDEFREGLWDASHAGLVAINRNAYVFLTDWGLELVLKLGKVLDEPPKYQHFAPAPPASDA